MRTLLNFEESTTGDDGRVEQLYPMDHDQTIIVRDAVMKDAGIYNCDSVEGEQLSTVRVIVEGRSGNLFRMLLTQSADVCQYNLCTCVKCPLVFLSVRPTPVPYSCSGFTSAWEPCQDENSRTAGPMLQESMSEFSMKLYSSLRESQPSSNLLFSPISISMVLSHLLLGMCCIFF